MKSASALLKNGIIYVQAYSATDAGLSVADGPIFKATMDNVHELAECVRSALEHSCQSVVPHPTHQSWNEIQAPMLKATRSKNWCDLAKGAKAIGIELRENFVTLTPSAGYENEGGTDLVDQAIVINIESSELGEMVISAFRHCS